MWLKITIKLWLHRLASSTVSFPKFLHSNWNWHTQPSAMETGEIMFYVVLLSFIHLNKKHCFIYSLLQVVNCTAEQINNCHSSVLLITPTSPSSKTFLISIICSFLFCSSCDSVSTFRVKIHFSQTLYLIEITSKWGSKAKAKSTTEHF